MAEGERGSHGHDGDGGRDQDEITPLAGVPRADPPDQVGRRGGGVAGGAGERTGQGVFEVGHRALPLAGRAVVAVERSLLRAREAWLRTVPREMPRISAISASLSSS